jgi:hypothetical protein
MSKRSHRKPIGEDGPLRISAPDGKTLIDWRKIEHPPEKQEQEFATASSFITALNTVTNSSWKILPLEENDFDFEMQSDNEKRYLELQEVIIPGKKHGPPYTPGEQVIDEQKFANTILASIDSKALKYPKKLGQALDLLIYNTHWRFLPNEAVLKLVAYGLKSRELPFAHVHFFHRLDQPSGRTTLLFPNPEFLRGFRPGQSSKYMNFDPADAQAVDDDGKVGVKFNVSANALKQLGLAR